ncbi:hypothetical protein D3C80_1775920 [compost metagenome]
MKFSGKVLTNNNIRPQEEISSTSPMISLFRGCGPRGAKNRLVSIRPQGAVSSKTRYAPGVCSARQSGSQAPAMFRNNSRLSISKPSHAATQRLLRERV